MTRTNKGVAGHQNPDVNFPQELGVYLAGEITRHIGTFLQFTYNQEMGKFMMDMTDIRYANNTVLSGKNLSYGITLNNGPTVEDLWNSTPAYSFPFIGSDTSATPTASPFLSNGNTVMMNSVGVGPYAMWNNHLYGVVSFYRTARQNDPNGPGSRDDALVGAAPYWRLAWSDDIANGSWEVGTFGFHAHYHPAGKPTNDTYTDTGVDAQYQKFSGPNLWELRANYIHENQTLNATAPGDASHHVNFFNVNGDWYYERHYGLGAGYSAISGDSLAAYGSPGTQPDSSYVTLQADWLPWLNTKFSLQYVAYNKFDGTSTNASDNNTLYLNILLAF